jgi:hypothetical protein
MNAQTAIFRRLDAPTGMIVSSESFAGTTPDPAFGLNPRRIADRGFPIFGIPLIRDLQSAVWNSP